MKVGDTIVLIYTGKFWYEKSRSQNSANKIHYVPAVSAYGNDANLSANFGAGYFKTTAVASAGTNASGVGTFEYDVPAGYTAFSTKGLNI